jgi:hypothetical protein
MTYGVYPHKMHLYQKPAVGNDFIRRLSVYNYRHTIAAVGGFDTASCDIAVRSRDEGQEFLDQFIGNRVAFYADNPVEPIWEGFINRMNFSSGGVDYSISLDEMANRVRVVYTTTAADPTVTQGVAATATVKSAYSQSLYGIKQEQIDLGLMQAGTGVTHLRDTVMAQKALPKSSIKPGSGGGGLLHIEFLGFYHTLMWEDYRNTVAGSAQLGTFVDTIIGGILNGTTFFDNTDTSLTVANTNTINQLTAKGETVWDALKKIQETGNTTNYFVIGVSPTDFQLGTRRFYYQVASTDIVYTARQSDGLRIRNLYGQLVPPWTVRPDAGVRVSDMLIGWNGIGDNPAETYITKIDYDANQQTAIYSGDDDISIEGAFNYRRFNKSYGKRNGQQRRVA